MRSAALVYKYFPEYRPDHHLEIFEASRLYFQSPLRFNDPFDCHIPLHIDPNEGTDAEWVTAFERILREMGADSDPDLAAKFAADPAMPLRMARRAVAMGDHRAPDLRNYKAMHRAQLDHLGILCLIERKDSLLMWSHYASSHTGFCLGFATEGYFGLAQRVIYSDVFPVPSLLRDSREELNRKILLAKSPEWQYENECRVIQYIEDGATRSLEYPPAALAEVIFGSRMTDVAKSLVIAALARSGRSPIILQAAPMDGAFQICFDSFHV
jgi:hypothetical protein